MHPLRVDILTAFLTLLIISSATIITYSYRKNSEMIMRFARDEMEKVSALAVTKTMTFLDDAQGASRLGSSLVDELPEVSINNRDLVNYMLATLRHYPYVENYYIGTSKGTFLMITSLPQDFSYLDIHPPRGARYRIRYINPANKQSEDTWIYLDSNGKEISTVYHKTTEYDPRKRPWFIKTKEENQQWSPLYPIEIKEIGYAKPSWSGIYVFQTLKKSGITVSETVYNRAGEFIGVFGTDISLDGISEFLSTQRIGKTGSEIIVTPQGEVIAGPNMLAENKSLPPGEQLTVFNTKNKSYEAAFVAFEQEQEDYFVSVFDGERYLASYTPFPQRFDQNWKILITVPLKDFLADIIRTHFHTLFISSAIFIVSAFLVVLLAKRISKPIVRLSHEIDEIRNFHLDNEINIRSNITEIHLIATATQAMQKAIRQFSFFVPKELVRRLITTGMDLGLGGQKKRLTIFFSDVQNFTGISESLSAEHLLIYLSEYLDEVSKVILEQKGTIDKYIGDNVMAFWGAPEDDPENAIHGCRAALITMKRLKELNRKWKGEGRPEFFTRIGVHKDEVIVGNIGTFERRNYTIIGDGVNLASRLEPINKIYGTHIIISEELHQEIGEHFVTRPLDIVAVRGKEKRTKIYELIGDEEREELKPSQEQVEFCKRFSKAFDLYLERKFKEASAIFEELCKSFPDDPSCKLYIDRCRQFVQNPPGDDWDPATKLELK